MGNYSKVKLILQKKKESLLGAVKSENGSVTVGGDEVDKANAVYEQEMAYKFKERGVNGIKVINEALERIDDDSYGICEECGDNISIKRLEIVPFAKLCVDCQEETEKAVVRR